MLRRLILSTACTVVVALAPVSVMAGVKVRSAGASVLFPVDAAEYGRPPPGRHGEVWATLFALTFDVTEVRDEWAHEAFLKALQSAEQWNAGDAAAQESFSFTTMVFPGRLAAILWSATCEPAPAARRSYTCRLIEVGGAPGREYFAWVRDPTREDTQPYLVQQIVVRNDRLYLLTYSGSGTAKGPAPTRPSTSRQKAFLNSLRFDGP